MKRFIIPFLLFCLGQASAVKADDTDLTNIDNVIYVEPLKVDFDDEDVIQKINENIYTTTLSICMKNTVPIRGFQFNLFLPDGMTAAVNNKGRIICSLNKNRLEEDDEHTLTLAIQDDGSILFLCGSQYDENFTGNDGEIISLTVNISADMEKGTYPIFLRNLKLTETDISKYYETAEVESSLIIERTGSGINGVMLLQDSDVPVFSLSGQRLAVPRKGVNIVGGKKVVVK